MPLVGEHLQDDIINTHPVLFYSVEHRKYKPTNYLYYIHACIYNSYIGMDLSKK